MDTVIITDSCCDLPLEYIEENNLTALNLSLHFKGKDYPSDFGKTLKLPDFYQGMREGEVATTSQANVFNFVEVFKKVVKENKKVIYIGFSSALSGCVNSAIIAKEQVLEEFKDADITVVDTLSASAGQGLLVYYAIKMQKEGSSKEEIVSWLEENKLKVNHWFTVEDLVYLKRGGRVSSTAAVIGTILDIKPVMHVDDLGRLIPVTKVKGRRKSLKSLAQELDNRIINPEEQIIFISHGDCYEDAMYLKNIILEKHKVKDVIISYVGPAVGAHSGPGTVALFFRGEKR
jgi:DegV family protein with EDD domain